MIKGEDKLLENPEMISKKVSLVIKKFKGAKERKDVKRKVIDNLYDVNAGLEQKITDLASTTNCAKEKEQAETVAELLNEVDKLDSQLKTEKAYLRDLEHQIQQAECKKLKMTKAKITSKGQAKQVLCDISKVEVTKEVWNKKLHAASCNLSKELIKNSDLREKIKSLLNERKNFNKEYNGLLEKLEDGKKLMQDLAASFTNSTLLRQNIINKIENIHLKEKKQMKLQDEEAQDLIMKREGEITWKHFYFKKTINRGIQNVTKRTQSSGEFLIESLEDYKFMIQTCFDMCNKKSEEDDSKKSIDHNDVIGMIKKNDCVIMGLMNYATQQNHEIYVLKDQVMNQGKKYEEISQHEEERQFLHEVQKQHLVSQKESLEESRLNIEDDKRGQRKILDKLYVGIENLVVLTKADITPLMFLLGENDKITDFNYNLYLQAVESKIMFVLGHLNLPKVNLALVILPVKEERTRTGEGQKSNRDGLEDKRTISQVCQMCYNAR